MVIYSIDDSLIKKNMSEESYNFYNKCEKTPLSSNSIMFETNDCWSNSMPVVSKNGILLYPAFFKFSKRGYYEEESAVDFIKKIDRLIYKKIEFYFTSDISWIHLDFGNLRELGFFKKEDHILYAFQCLIPTNNKKKYNKTHNIDII